MKTPNAAIAVLFVLGLGVWGYFWWARLQTNPAPPARAASAEFAPSAAPVRRSAPVFDNTALTFDDSAPDASPGLLRSRLERMLAHPTALPDETLLTFKTDADYRAFLERAARSGLLVVSQIDAFKSARVRFDSVADLEAELRAHPGAYREIAANHRIEIPAQPDIESRADLLNVPFNNTALAFIGAVADRSAWGRGVTIAVIDSGVLDDPSLANRVRHLDLGLGRLPVESGSGHGTAVATLAAGSGNDAPGVAPAADILSIRVTDTNGSGDSFTLARAILAATDAGAKIINVSLGGHATSGHLIDAIAYATEHGALIVAAAGNDQADRLVWPAASPQVLSVGAVDALGQLATFSNSGDNLGLTAPGYGLQTAWTEQRRVLFSGTSAATPIVSGALAALLSLNPGMTPVQAAATLTDYSNDAGAPGADPLYGHGTLNLGWALNRNNTARIDAAIAGQTYDPVGGVLTITVQNRSAVTLHGLTLGVNAGGTPHTRTLPSLLPGVTATASVPIDQRLLKSSGTLTIQSALTLPHGITDADPGNNTRASVLFAN